LKGGADLGRITTEMELALALALLLAVAVLGAVTGHTAVLKGSTRSSHGEHGDRESGMGGTEGRKSRWIVPQPKSQYRGVERIFELADITA
jgi:hypothetical protein